MLPATDNSRLPDVTVYPDGKINIAARIVHALGISPGDVIDVHSEPPELYIYIRHRKGQFVGRHTGVCKFPNGRRGTMRTYSKRIAAKILAAITPAPTDKTPLPCGNLEIRHGTPLIPIITKTISPR